MKYALFQFGIHVGLLLSACSSDERPPIFTSPLVSDTSVQAVQVVPNPDVPHERLPSPLDSFTETACQFAVADHVTQCGVVLVPESPGSETSIELAIARVFSRSASPQSEPVVYLDGGPGAASLENIQFLYTGLSAIAPDRDFIFVDQRGVGLSRPHLRCTEGGDLNDALDQCYERLSKTNDLSAYTSRNNATDIDLVREALGYETWNLLGISYGTRLALTIMRDYPASVRAVLLDSVVPLQVDPLGELGRNAFHAFERAFEACALNGACAQVYPDSMAAFLAVAKKLEADPHDSGSLTITADIFVSQLFQLLYSPRGVEVVPFLIAKANEDDFEVFLKIATAQAEESVFSFAMHLSLHCAEEIPFSSVEHFATFDGEVDPNLRPLLSAEMYLAYCEHWPVSPAPLLANQAVESDIPTLVMAGHFDPVTPPRFAEAAHEFLERAQYVLVPNESHGASLGECGGKIAKAFFLDPEKESDAGCLDTLPVLDFETLARGVEPARVPPLRIHLTEPTDEIIQEIKDEVRRRRR